jgi:hypothetical protein
MLTQLLVILVPLLWLTVTALILAACRAAARADAMTARPAQSGELEWEIVTIDEPPGAARGSQAWHLTPPAHRA